MTERPIKVRGETVALARLRAAARAPEADELRFLRSQTLGLVAVAGLLLLLALATAWWLARQWVRPLVAVQDATARIARGEFALRLPENRGDEIGAVLRNVNAMAQGLQKLEGARRRWMANMSHELRTPLTVLRGEIEALADGVRPLGQAAVASLREEVMRLSGLVDDLHLLAMADLQVLPCRFAEVDALALLDGLILKHEPAAAKAGLTLAWSQRSAGAVTVRWDEARIGQLLLNLLHNSLRYTDAPGRVALSLRPQGDSLRISVADSAPGLAAGDLERVFEPLFRADNARSQHNGGSGLGLAICVALARSHGGRISAGPSALGGLQIEVDLPLIGEARPA